ncbi:hypothetical protein [Puniceicoccus vermicola]|uniref:Pathogenicity locus n=1 Tax=Puniceicoccus vermicola TaxID=388746 RepID=A0A7X1E7S6_9BACT|nr:hypothetical protein [Puniceicoccus vermicola]MBC2604042.1 hypothetical protein [Puniceicoccus vermicola]
MPPEPARKKKKVDYEALNAPLMQIPGMKVDAVRALLNAGVREIYELSGRAPEVLFEESRAKDPEINPVLLPYFRMAVYYAETDRPDKSLMSPYAWES